MPCRGDGEDDRADAISVGKTWMARMARRDILGRAEFIGCKGYVWMATREAESADYNASDHRIDVFRDLESLGGNSW